MAWQTRRLPISAMAAAERCEAPCHPNILGVLAELPAAVQRVADGNYELLKADPQQPSLHFKRIGRMCSVRIGIHYRAVGVEDGPDVVWFWIGITASTTGSLTPAGHLKTREVGDVLEHAVRRIERHLDRCGLLETREDDLDLSGEGDPESNLASSAVSGQSPPAGPQSPEGRLRAGRLAFDRPGCTHSPTTSRSAHRLMGLPCTRRPARAGSTPGVERRCCATCYARRSRKSEWSSSPTASFASP